MHLTCNLGPDDESGKVDVSPKLVKRTKHLSFDDNKDSMKHV